MLRKRELLDEPGLRLEDVRCTEDVSSWSTPELSKGYAVVFVRRGCFRRRVDGAEALLDPAVVYFETPGQEQEVAHPCAGGDACTAFALSAEVAAELWGGDPELPREPLFSDSALDLQHRKLLATSSTDEFEVSERALTVLAEVLDRACPGRVASGRPGTVAARKHGVDAAREAIASDPRVGLLALARLVAISPHHLSRIFSERTGESISRYRNRIRVRLALDRLADGETSLARLALELGFADQAHLARVVRSEVGEAPSRLRPLLAAAAASRA